MLRLSFIMVMVLVVVLPQSTFAQDNNIARLYMVKIKPGTGPQFEGAFKKHLEWRKKAGDTWNWTVMQVANGQNLGEYIIRSGGHSWADLDTYADFLAKGAVEFNKTVSPHIISISSMITRGNPDINNWVGNPEEIKMISMTTYYLKPDQGMAFNQALSKIHKLVKEHNYPIYYATAAIVNGGMGQRVRIVTPLKSWADMAGPEEEVGAFLNRAAGSLEAQNLFKGFMGAVRTTETSVLQMRPDLSLQSSN